MSMKIIRKNINFETKQDPGRPRAFWVTGSTEDIDRDGDRILSSGWHFENFLKNPVIPWAHMYQQPPVAKALDVKVIDKKLKLLIQFATAEEYAFADTIYRLYKGKYLNAFSVGFSSIRSERVERTINGQKRSGYDFIENELWEVSACTVPSNPNALAEAKQKGIITPGELEGLQTRGASSGTISLTKDETILIAKTCSRLVTEKIGKVIDRRLKYHLGIID